MVEEDYQYHKEVVTCPYCLETDSGVLFDEMEDDETTTHSCMSCQKNYYVTAHIRKEFSSFQNEPE